VTFVKTFVDFVFKIAFFNTKRAKEELEDHKEL